LTTFANTLSRKEFLKFSASLVVLIVLMNILKTLAGVKAASQKLAEPFLLRDSLLHSAFRSRTYSLKS
jgi:hypothetical protein